MVDISLHPHSSPDKPGATGMNRVQNYIWSLAIFIPWQFRNNCTKYQYSICGWPLKVAKMDGQFQVTILKPGKEEHSTPH